MFGLVIREVTYVSILIRILAAFALGGIIGMERGMKNRPAGLRTYMLVCVGSCLIMLTNQYIIRRSAPATRCGWVPRWSAASAFWARVPLW